TPGRRARSRPGRAEGALTRRRSPAAVEMDVNRLLRSAPVKQEFGPTLPQLLAPRIDSLPRIAGRIAAVLAVLVVGAAVLVALRNRDPVYTHPGPAATRFSTSYSRV